LDVINNGNITHNHDSKTESSIEDFGLYISNNKPTWYKPGKSMEKNKLHNQYEELYGDISMHMFHKTFLNKLFKNPKRVTVNNKKVTKVTLLKYNEIQFLEI
jgi:hypothetical protein